MALDKAGFLILPVGLVSRTDTGRLLKEVSSLDDFLRQAVIRDPNAKVTLPRSSLLFDEIVTANKLNILEQADRTRLIQFLESVKAQAPVLHISFSADPSPLFIKQLMTWLRKEIHSLVLLQIGLQPNIGAGCVVRTTNKHFDFSLKQRFVDKRDQLIQGLHGPAVPQPVKQESAKP